jgi:glycosyltransferase involved in cell wall biosynthesis
MAGPHPDAAALTKLLPRDVDYIEIPALQREIRPRKDLKALLVMKRGIKRLGPAIVHTHTSKAGALGRLAAAWANLGAKKPAVIIHTPHGHVMYGYYGPLKTFVFKLAERFLAEFTDYFIALTPGEERESLAAGLGRAEQWEVIHSGVDFTAPARLLTKTDLGLPEDCVAAGTIARLEPVKGVEYLIRAANLLKDRVPGLRLVVIGGGTLQGRLHNLTVALGIKERVIFTGFRADADALLSALDIYVQPSLNEAMGRAPLEAQALGLPAVVSAVCGLPDIIKEGETGFAVKTADPEALAAAIEKLALSAQLRARLGAAAKAWALSKDADGLPRFGRESMNRKLKKFYNRVIAG